MNIPVEKNKEYIVDIIDNGFEGEGIAKIDGFTIFIPKAIKGEKIKILIVKVLSSHAFGKIIEILSKSEHRVEEDCDTYKRCGGCNLRHVDYEETLNIKQNTVQTLVNKTLENKINVNKTWGMGNPYNYRNKLIYPVGISRDGTPTIGVYANRTHEIIPIQDCMIQNKEATKIAKYIITLIEKYNISVYDENNGTGLIRSIMIKTGIKTNQILVTLVINGNVLPCVDDIKKDLINSFNNIKSIVININKKNTNVVLGENNKVIFGSGYMEDYLGDFLFKVSTNSFFQVNPVQAEALYNIALENLHISKDDIVFDLYCGIGTITLFASKFAKKVYGIEIVNQAIEDARQNAIGNNIDNTEFIAGDVEKILSNLIDNNIIPNIVIVDPPRRGLDKITIENIIKIGPERFAYISCNPATLVRDLKEFEKFYNIDFIQPVDMFPYTSHVECVTILTLKM